MVRLHLVGFTTDLKNLIFADEPGATSGGYVVSVDSRLRHTLDEVARLDEEAAEYDSAEPEEPQEPQAPPAPRVVSKLTPKEIQSLLRQGKTEEQVARLAGTNVEWVQRFSFAILAERRDVIDAVKAARLSKPRLGPSGMSIGDAVEENIATKRVRMGPDAIDAAWKAMRKNGRWQVSFEYESRGQKRLARYSFDPNTRQVEPLNDIAMELGWRSESRGKAAPPRTPPGPPKMVSGVRSGTARSGAAKPASRPAAKPAGGRSSTGRGTGQDRPVSAGTRPTAKPASQGTRRSTIAARSRAEEAGTPQEQPAPRRRPVAPPAEQMAEDVRRTSETPPDQTDPDATSDEFIIQRPRNPERSQYSSLPQVWRPSRRT